MLTPALRYACQPCSDFDRLAIEGADGAVGGGGGDYGDYDDGPLYTAPQCTCYPYLPYCVAALKPLTRLVVRGLAT